MRYLTQLLCAAVIVGLATVPAGAQQMQVTTAGGATTASVTGAGGLVGGGVGGIGGGASGLGGTSLTQMETAPNITSLDSATGSTGMASVTRNASNIFSATFDIPAYFANPYYQGTPTNAQSSALPGGFGTALYPTAAGTAAGGRGAAGATGTRGGIRGGTASTANQFGTIISLPVQVSYPAIARFPAAPVTKLQSDLTGMIGRSTMIANPAGVQVITEGSTVTLRGTAKDADEARMIAGMVRMTPGVRAVNNELHFPQP